jgi:hypothetical protein
MGDTVGLAEFKAQLRAQFPDAFRLHREVALLLEPGVQTPRVPTPPLLLALDMLFVQSYKAHLSTYAAAELGHTEDSATLCRRLLELGVLAGYIGLAEPEKNREERARRYLADMWNDLPVEGRSRLPEATRQQWEESLAGTPRGAFPSFQKMFVDVGQGATYKEDYSLLSRIAHGASSDQLIAYGQSPVPVRAPWHIGTLLVFASRYYLGTAVVWNEHFRALDEAKLDKLVQEAAQWAAKASEEEHHAG